MSSKTTMSGLKQVTHVLFDMDGLLLNTEDLYTMATNNVAERYGRTYPWELKVKVMGKTANEGAKMLVQGMDLPLTPEQYLKEIDEEYSKVFPSAILLPGVQKLVSHLKESKVPIAIATSSKKQSYDLKTSNHQQFFNEFDHIVYGSDDPEVIHGKPAPDTFLVAANRFPHKVDPSKVLVFEDSPIGVKAGKAAGMTVVMIPHQMLDRNLCNEADLVLNSMEEFEPELYGLPPYGAGGNES